LKHFPRRIDGEIFEPVLVVLRTIAPCPSPTRVGQAKGTFVPLGSFLAQQKGVKLMLGTILLIVLILLLVGALPSWPYSSGWGYGPSGVLGTVVVVLLILVLIGRI
jgi:hypothetical protein